jgi:hypothetical protein
MQLTDNGEAPVSHSVVITKRGWEKKLQLDKPAHYEHLRKETAGSTRVSPSALPLR